MQCVHLPLLQPLSPRIKGHQEPGRSGECFNGAPPYFYHAGSKYFSPESRAPHMHTAVFSWGRVEILSLRIRHSSTNRRIHARVHVTRNDFFGSTECTHTSLPLPRVLVLNPHTNVLSCQWLGERMNAASGRGIQVRLQWDRSRTVSVRILPFPYALGK